MILYIFISLIIKLSNIESKIVIKFIRDNLLSEEENKTTLGEFIINRVINNYKTSIYIGEPPQKLPGFLKTNIYSFLLNNEECSNKILFKENESTSFKIIKKNVDKYFPNSKIISESLYFQEDINETEKYKKIENFELYTEMGTETPLCFHIGTKLSIDYFDKNYPLINTLHQKKYITSYKYSYKIISDDEMFLILDLDINKESYKFVKPIYDSLDNKPIWGLTFQHYTFDNKNLDNIEINAKFDINVGIIKASYSFYPIFKDYAAKYSLNYTKENYQQYLDGEKYKIILFYNDEQNKKKLRNFNISFYHKELNYNFTLNYEDLFLEKETYIYFMIVFYKSKKKEWIFGYPFFKKYNFVYDQDNKLIGFEYNYEQRYNNRDEDFNKNSNNRKTILLMILGIVIFVGIALVLGVLLGRKIFGVRKTKVNELLELYDYSAKNSGKK